MGIQRYVYAGTVYQPPGSKAQQAVSWPRLMDQADLAQWTGPSPQDKLMARQLEHIGLPPNSIRRLLKTLSGTNDQLYHAGRLVTGKIYVITTQDQLYYGWPCALKPVKITHLAMNRCIDRQVRNYTAENGLRLRIRTQNNTRTAKVWQSWMAKLKLSIPHARQAPLTALGSL